MATVQRQSTSRGLAFLALLSFVAAFLAARVFSTLSPDTVVIAGGIHFHHFWYGLAMIVVAGWLGIGYNRPQYRRFYAVLFGLGCGLVGDEVGLLLTFGDYDSSLTFFFFIIAVSGASFAMLLTRGRRDLEYDVFSLRNEERLVYVGVVIAGLSALTFASGYILLGVAIMVTGLAITAVGLWLHRRGVAADAVQKSGDRGVPP